MIEIWESKIEKEGLSEIPVIIPLVIYHDKNQWQVKTKLSDMMNGYNQLPKDVKKYIPDYEYLVYDLAEYKDEDIKLEAITRIIIKFMRDVRHASKEQVVDIITEGFILLNEIIEKDTVTHYMESCLRYVLSVRNDIEKDELIQIADRISVEGSELVMTIADKIREEGIGIGEKKGIIKVAQNAIIDGMSVDGIMRITGLTEKEIDKIRKEMLQR